MYHKMCISFGAIFFEYIIVFHLVSSFLSYALFYTFLFGIFGPGACVKEGEGAVVAMRICMEERGQSSLGSH